MLAPVDVADQTWGEPNAARSNAVLAPHARRATATRPVRPGRATRSPAGGNPSSGPGVRSTPIGASWCACRHPRRLPGDDRPRVPCARRCPYGSRFPRITIRDQVAVEAALADHLEIAGMRSSAGRWGACAPLEWAVAHPARVVVARRHLDRRGRERCPEQIALCSVQIEAIRGDPRFRGGDYYDAAPGDGPHRGWGSPGASATSATAPRPSSPVGSATTRRPARTRWPAAGTTVESYLDHQAQQLVRRFDANSYVALSDAMNHHDVGRGRVRDRRGTLASDRGRRDDRRDRHRPAATRTRA